MNVRTIALAAILLAGTANAADVAPTYTTPGYSGGAVGVVTLCPSADGSNTAVACGTAGTSSNVTIVGPDGPEGGVSVSINPYRANATNNSGGIAVGGAWMQLFPANMLRTRLFVQNYCSAATQAIAATESLFVAVSPVMPTGTPMATPGPVELVTCGVYDSSSAVVGTAPVWLWASSTGHHFVGLEW
jgi:hypothetical protein